MLFTILKRLIAFSSVCFIACSDNKTSVTMDTAGGETVHSRAADTIVTNARPLVLSGCYEMVMKQDTASLVLHVTDTTVTGNLNFHWYQKDRNEGTLKGVLRNDMIYADYSFQSEGLTSVREIIFKIKDTTLLQGTGELAEQNGKIVYQDKENLSFNETYPFIKVACNKPVQ